MAEHAAVRNAADAEQVREARGKSERRVARLENGLKDIMGTPAAREYVAELLAFCDAKTVVYGATQDERAFRDGMRNVALRLEADIERVCPGSGDMMRAEIRARRKADG